MLPCFKNDRVTRVPGFAFLRWWFCEEEETAAPAVLTSSSETVVAAVAVVNNSSSTILQICSNTTTHRLQAVAQPPQPSSLRDIRWRFAWYARWLFSAWLVGAFLVDLAYLMVEQFINERRETAYGADNGPFISLIYILTYCNAQLALFMAATAVLFLQLRRGRLLACARQLAVLVRTLDVQQTAVVPRLRCLKACFWTVVLLVMGCLVPALFDSQLWIQFRRAKVYANMTVSNGWLNFYLRGYDLNYM